MNPNLEKLAKETKNPDVSPDEKLINPRLHGDLLVVQYSNELRMFDTTLRGRDYNPDDERRLPTLLTKVQSQRGFCVNAGIFYYADVGPYNDTTDIFDLNKKVRTVSRKVRKLISDDYILYDVGYYGVYETMTDKIVFPDEVTGICSHEGTLIFGKPTGIFELPSCKEIDFDKPPIALCSHEGDLYVSYYEDNGKQKGKLWNQYKVRNHTQGFGWLGTPERVVEMCSHDKDIFYVGYDEKADISSLECCGMDRSVPAFREFGLTSNEIGGMCSVPRSILLK
jgi:hypothetical protein